MCSSYTDNGCLCTVANYSFIRKCKRAFQNNIICLNYTICILIITGIGNNHYYSACKHNIILFRVLIGIRMVNRYDKIIIIYIKSRKTREFVQKAN